MTTFWTGMSTISGNFNRIHSHQSTSFLYCFPLVRALVWITSKTEFRCSFYVQYLNTPVVQAAIGAYVNFSGTWYPKLCSTVYSRINADPNVRTEYSTAVGNAFNTTGDDGREDDTVENMLELLEYWADPILVLLMIANVERRQGITVMMYTGDADYNCNW